MTGLEAHRMRIAVIFAVSALLAVDSGRAEAADTCLSKATEALPRISGLVVKKSRTRPRSGYCVLGSQPALNRCSSRKHDIRSRIIYTACPDNNR